MKYILITNTALCTVLGFILVLFPVAIIDFKTAEPLVVAVARCWGFSVLVMAFLGLFMNRLSDNLQFNQAGLFLLTIFHGGMTLTTALGSYQGFFPSPWPFIHLLITLVLIRFVLRVIKQQ